MFEALVVGLLITITGFLWRLVRMRDIAHRHIRALFALPPERVLVTDGTVDAGFGFGPPQNAIEELRQFAMIIAFRLRRIEGAAAYLRNYVWEQLDQRTLQDIKHPTPSAYWGGKVFAAPDSADYGLWTRERDFDAGFTDAMRDAAKSSPRASEPPAKSDSGGGDLPA
jgi:hypothetical protein